MFYMGQFISKFAVLYCCKGEKNLRILQGSPPTYTQIRYFKAFP